MPFNPNITPGSAPLLWSNVDEAFSRINENFDILVATIGAGSGLIPLDFNTLDTNVSPTVSDTYSLGSNSNRWRSVYTEEWSSIGAGTFNGVWVGTAQIKGISGTVDLPTGSTVNGNLIIDPDKTFFKAVQVDAGERVEANEFNDTLNLLSGPGISMTVGSPGESITIENTGLVSVVGVDNISAVTVAGVTTISNTGVRSFTNIGTLPVGRTVGAGIYIDSSTGAGIKITNTGILGFDNSGFGTNISVDAATGLATVNLSTGVVSTAAFRTIAVTGTAGQINVEADAPADTLTLNAGTGIEITTNPVTDTISFSVTGNLDIQGSVYAQDSGIVVDSIDRKFYGDLTGDVLGNVIGDVVGSIFADDSTTLVDAVNGFIYGEIRANTLRTNDNTIILGQDADGGNYSVSVGYNAGNTNQGDGTVALGVDAGYQNQGNYSVAVGRIAGYQNQATQAVAIGFESGILNQGTNAIAIGYRAGYSNQTAGSIVLNASGAAQNASVAGFFVNPIRSTANGRPLMYDNATKEISSSNVLEFIGSTISTSDSSNIVVDVLTVFNSDINVQNEIILQGSRVINLDELKTIVATSISFNDFQTRIAALV